MDVIDAYDPVEAVLLMTLSACAYIDAGPLPGETVPQQEVRMRGDIDAALGVSSPTTDWRVVWGPVINEDRSNMMYAAGDVTSDRYAVAVRGTVWSFWVDWLEDFTSVLPLVEYPYLSSSSDAQARIAAGTFLGLQQLMTMTWTDSSGKQTDLPGFLQGTPANAQIFVTGHSLGGCLASVLAPWLTSTLGNASRLKIYTFAAPSAGDKTFATGYNTLFMDKKQNPTAFRVYNTLDVVPNAWASLPTIETYYTPLPPCPDDVKSLIREALTYVGATYVQVGDEEVGSARKLDGHLIVWPEDTAQLDPVGDALFLYEAAEQHGSRNYLKLLNAEPIDATIVKVRGAAQRLRLKQ